jgi:hypothetical protein
VVDEQGLNPALLGPHGSSYADWAHRFLYVAERRRLAGPA